MREKKDSPETMMDDSRTFPHPVQTASALLASTSMSVDPQASHFITLEPPEGPAAAMAPTPPLFTNTLVQSERTGGLSRSLTGLTDAE